MLLPASPEFVDLCRAQVALIVQGLGAAASAVYLTDEFAEPQPAQMLPIVVYPEETQPDSPILRLPQRHPQSPDRLSSALDHLDPLLTSGPDRPADRPQLEHLVLADRSQGQPDRLILPLMHEAVVLGLLVVSRQDRQWNLREQNQLQQVANTLAIACLLDQRYQWLLTADYQQQSLKTQQHHVLTNLLHQFRNPLTTLRTLSSLLFKRLLPSDPNQRLAFNLLQESDRLQGLLQQFDLAIDLGEAALETPKHSPPNTTPRQLTPAPEPPLLSASSIGLPLQLQPCCLSEVLAPLLQSAAAIAQDRQLTFTPQIPANLPPVAADLQGLREALSNLIDNALKYTPAGETVQVEVSRDPVHRQQAIAIRDTGPGIPPQDLPHLFERHFRGVQSEGKIPGTGLGLAIAQALLQQMQGSLAVTSPWQPQNRLHPGSCFTVLLSEPLDN
jgi:signal transduction histidine kinase